MLGEKSEHSDLPEVPSLEQLLQLEKENAALLKEKASAFYLKFLDLMSLFYVIFNFFLRDFIYKKTLFKKLQY